MAGENDVALAALAIVATTVGALIYMVKYFARTLSKDLQEHTKAAIAQTHASIEQKEASKEVLLFMKNLNGKLATATIAAAKEQEEKK